MSYAIITLWEWGYKFVNKGKKAIKPNYLLQTKHATYTICSTNLKAKENTKKILKKNINCSKYSKY